MCDPITLSAIGSAASSVATAVGTMSAGTALSIGTSVAKFAADDQLARETNKRNAAQQLQIGVARDDKISQQKLSQSQQEAKLAQQKIDNDITALEQASTSALSAGESNVAGRVVNAVMAKNERDRLTTNNTIDADLQTLALQGTLDRKGIDAEALSMINQYQPVRRPSVLGLGLEAGTDYYDRET
jgi:hypothetical protein